MALRWVGGVTFGDSAQGRLRGSHPALMGGGQSITVVLLSAHTAVGLALGFAVDGRCRIVPAYMAR